MTNGQLDRLLYGQTDNQRDRYMDKRTIRQIDIWTNGQSGRLIYGQTDNQTD